MINPTLNPQHVIEYHQDLGVECESASEINWVCEQIQALSIQQRALTTLELKIINSKIKCIPTGRQRRLTSARDQVLFYLNTICEWQLPSVKAKQFEDAQMVWMLNILKHSQTATTLVNRYRTQRENFMTQRWADTGWLLLVLNMEVAPLPMRYWADVLSTPTAIEFFEGQFTLKIKHSKPITTFDSQETPSFTRYRLPPFAYRLLQDFYLTAPLQRYTTHQLNHLLNAWGKKSPYYFDDYQSSKWMHIFQCIWYGHHRLPAPFLRDFSDPMRHVATTSALLDSNKQDLSQLYQLPAIKFSWGLGAIPKYRSWPHKALIKHHQGQRIKLPVMPEWQRHNLLPALFYGFVKELFEQGGIKRTKLQPESIDRYTNFYQHLSPLSFTCASNPKRLHAWAYKQFKTLQGQSTPWHLYNFLRYVSHQEFTDHLDLSKFERPTLPSLVDPCCLSVTQIHHTAEALLSSDNGHALQRLLATAALLLGYYGTLRRGEVLRLRMGDIALCPKDKRRFYLTITKTKEGEPKGGKSRTIAAYLPEVSAKLIRVLLKIKERTSSASPFIALEGETISQREQHYLYPVTQALKLLWGSNVRFHHLRHSGADLLYLQGLHLAYQRPKDHLACVQGAPEIQNMLTKATCKARFDFWLEGQDFEMMNDAILLDVIGSELGHSHYATTRKHYLHGLEKVGNILTNKRLKYSRDELRYLLDMPTGSNYLSQVLNEIHPNYPLLSNEQKKRYVLTLSDTELLPKLITRHRKLHGNGLSSQAPLPKNPLSPEKSWHPNSFFMLWAGSLPKSFIEESSLPFCLFNRQSLNLNHTLSLDFSTLSQQWLALKKLSHLSFKGKDLAALKALGVPKVIENVRGDLSKGDASLRPYISVIFCVKCNRKVHKAFTHLFKEGVFKTQPATLSLVQNRRSLQSTKHHTVNTMFRRKNDHLQRFIIPEGKSTLIIELHTNILANHLISPLTQHFMRHSCHQSGELRNG